MATVQQIIERAYTKVNGEYEAVAETSDDFKTYLNVLNQVMEKWSHTPYVKWQSLLDLDYTLSTPVVTGVLHYAVPDMDRIVIGNTPFDHVFFVSGTVVLKKYKMLDQPLFQASNAPNTCTLAQDGLYLKNVSDDIVGASIQFPAYLLPPQYTSATTEVRIDSNSWLITAMAAFICDASPVPFIARNADKFAKEAEVLMKSMRERNRHSQLLSMKKVKDTTDYASLSEAINAGVGIGVGGGGVYGDIDGGTF